MQQYNSSISQAFMVMSFAAAGLLISVQLSGDRSSPPNRQAIASVSSRVSVSPSDSAPTRKHQASSVIPHSDPSNRDEVNRVADPISAPSTLHPNHLQQDRTNRPTHTQTKEAVVEEAGWRPTRNQWSWIVQPILSPIRTINERLARSSHGPTPQSEAIGKIKEEVPTMPALPSRNDVVSQSVSQARLDSTPSSPFNQHTTSTRQTSTGQTNQTEHTLAERWEEDDGDQLSSLPPSLTETEPQPFSISSTQPSTHVNPTTQDSTNQAIAIEEQTEQNRIQQEHPTARLVVDLSDRQLAFYQHNEEAQTYPIAVGKAGWETPLGEFTVTDKDPSPLWKHPLTGELVPAGANSPLGSRWIGFWSDGIHQIGFHGTNQSQSIGQAISHGCIRLHDADIQALYTQVALGTPVIVQP